MKPDVVAPGEKILSAGTGKLLMDRAEGKQCEYVEHSGTSVAAAHVSGAIAGFLSVKREFIGQPEDVKLIFCETAEDLKRDRSFQGYGLIDLYSALASFRPADNKTEKRRLAPAENLPGLPVAPVPTELSFSELGTVVAETEVDITDK